VFTVLNGLRLRLYRAGHCCPAAALVTHVVIADAFENATQKPIEEQHSSMLLFRHVTVVPGGHNPTRPKGLSKAECTVTGTQCPSNAWRHKGAR